LAWSHNKKALRNVNMNDKKEKEIQNKKPKSFAES
jgi:hypothetical protein